MRKKLSLILVLALSAVMAYGVIGTGALFQWTGTATQAISVGSFGCALSSTQGAVSPDGTSVTYTTPKIMSSAAGSAPFAFTVTATGEIPVRVHVTQSDIGAPFSGILATPIADVDLAQTETHTYNAGVKWTELGTANAGTQGSVTWTVACNEQAPEPLPANTYVYKSTNANNIANGWANVTAVPGAGSVTLTFTQPRAFYACFEYRTDGNVPEQRLNVDGVTVGVAPFAPSMASGYGIVGINDGLYKHVCLSAAGSTRTVVVPVATYVEVRVSFGAESDERFDWTRFNAS